MVLKFDLLIRQRNAYIYIIKVEIRNRVYREKNLRYTDINYKKVYARIFIKYKYIVCLSFINVIASLHCFYIVVVYVLSIKSNSFR